MHRLNFNLNTDRHSEIRTSRAASSQLKTSERIGTVQNAKQRFSFTLGQNKTTTFVLNFTKSLFYWRGFVIVELMQHGTSPLISLILVVSSYWKLNRDTNVYLYFVATNHIDSMTNKIKMLNNPGQDSWSLDEVVSAVVEVGFLTDTVNFLEAILPYPLNLYSILDCYCLSIYANVQNKNLFF